MVFGIWYIIHGILTVVPGIPLVLGLRTSMQDSLEGIVRTILEYYSIPIMPLLQGGGSS